MPNRCKLYVGAVITAGSLLLGASLLQWTSPEPLHYLAYLALTLLASLLKLRLPRMTGTYSLNFLFILIGIAHFTLPETLLAGCAAGAFQTVFNTKQRPTLVQVLFNVGNLSLSMGVCFLAVYGPLSAVLESFRPAALALVACLYFVTNTVLVSGVLSLLQGKPLREVCQEWYVWSFPYYLIGAALVGLLPFSDQSLPPEASLVLMPLLYLMHFYYGLSKELPADGAGPTNKPNEGLERLSTWAKLYLGAVITMGSALLAWSLLNWEWKDPMQFLVYLAVVQMASACKVRLPRITGTISVNFVVLLAAIAELSLPEVVALSAVAAMVQCLWKPKVRPKPIQIPFSVGTMVLSSAFAFTICRLVLDGLLADSLALLFVLATTLLYAGNTILVSTAWGLAEGVPLRTVWPRCCFWSFPYYLVGAAFAAFIVVTSQEAGWQLSFLALPLMALVYVSYRLHVGRVAEQG